VINWSLKYSLREYFFIKYVRQLRDKESTLISVRTTGQSLQSFMKFMISREILSNIIYDYQIHNSLPERF